MPPLTLPSFRDPALLETALTHRSALNEKLSGSGQSYERLEFLGDAVLELATTQYLFDAHPRESEGVLTAYRSALVKTTTLAEVAKALGLPERIYMSKGESNSGGRQNDGILADVFEAVVGALYLDQNYQAVVEYLRQVLFPKFVDIKTSKTYIDPKSHLQEVVQSRGMGTPSYRVTAATGPDHDKEFVVQVMVKGKTAGQGSGKSKQLAQQAAAQQALEVLLGQ
ncbi:MAG: ribonuclease III [Candidatus Pacebacteria bacterium CG10_big_fil_rev_8_21_14_0_10_56_10]|nr:MAG: ribonuclease III [Candidatus Pacebacteria bacterium CG10_big_fil_rev_8_21_14_0_10_56_10]